MEKGRIKTVGPIKNKCFQFVIENVDPCINKVIPIFENIWLPTYKTKQFKKFKKACCMLKCNYLNTKKDFKDFLDIVYDMSSNSKRKYNKQKLLEWAELKLNKKKFVKKKHKLYEKLMGSDINIEFDQ